MSFAGNQRLRAVVNDYYQGHVSFEVYRERRRKILDALGVASDKPQPQSRASETLDTTATPRPAALAPVAPKPASEPPRLPIATNLRWAIVAAFGIGVLAAIGFVVLRPSDTVSPEVRSEGAAPAPQLPAGVALLEQFLQKNAWDQDSVRKLEGDWTGALSEEQRQTATASPSYARFGDVLLRRLREEEALSSSGETPEFARLVGLATALKMSYAASLSRPASRSVAPPARVPADDPGAAPSVPASSAAAPELTNSSPAEQHANDAPVRAPPPAAPRAAPVSAPVNVPPVTAAGTAPAETRPAAANGDAPACSADLLATRRRICLDPLRGGGEGPALAVVPGGTFRMGSDQTRNAGPAHDVTIAAPFAVAVYETSFAEFERYCKSTAKRCPDNPWGDAAFPVVFVDWNEATAYAEWLSAETGQHYRLPSEAEWEYAARAGTQTPYPFGNDVTPSSARSSAISQVASPIANTDRSVNRNQFQLLHMIGNVREWVADAWQPDYAGAPGDGSARLTPNATAHVVRGGSYADSALQLRSAARIPLDTETHDKVTGFRLVRDLAR